MNIISLASGSKGNSTLILTTKYNLLVDVGLSMKRINKLLLMSEGIDLNDINFILISHMHFDHIQSFNTIFNKYSHIKFVMDSVLKKEVDEHFKKTYDIDRFVLLKENSKGNNLTINSFVVSHDRYALSYIIKDEISGESLVFICDNGMYPYKLKEIEYLKTPHTYYMVESNYDMYSQYIDETRNELLKRRVLSTNGHSDNFNAIEKVTTMLEMSNNTICKGVMFHHLSEHCNSEELASKSHNAYISTWGKKNITKDIKITYARQQEIVRLN
jgi:phosphoribosyl 1,2-cyclic phosphodiesterase